MKLSLKLIPIFLLIILATFVRFYRLPATQTFLEDEGRDMLMVKYMVDHKRPVLLGPQTSTGNMYLGPFYYYFITPALILANFNPLGPAALIALTGILTVYLLYIFVSHRFGQKAGFLAALLYAVMPLPIMFTRNSWNPNLVPLVSLLTIWVVDKLLFEQQLKSKQQAYLSLALGVLTGILVQLHYMTLVMFPFLALVLLLKLKKKFLLTSLLSLFTFTLVLSPFLIFEVRHHFVNTQAIIRFIQAKQEHNIRYSLPFWLWKDKVAKTSTQLIDSLLGRGAFQAIDPFAKPITLGFFILLFIYSSSLVARRSLLIPRPPSPVTRHFFYLSLLIFSLATLGIYQENIHLHYLGFLFPLIYILLAIMIAQSKQIISFLATCYLLLATAYSLPTTFQYLNSGPTYQVEKARAVAQYIAHDAGNQPYNIVSRNDTSSTPYQYFLSLTPNPPTNQLAPTLYLICQDSPCKKDDVNYDLLFVQGPAHPYLRQYVGRPIILYFSNPRQMVSNQHVSHGVWVAKIKVNINK